MKTIIKINNILLILLGLATGLVKVFGLEADVEIFANMGFSYTATVIFGAVQAIAASLVIFPQTRRYGAVILGLSFVIATAGLFISGLIPFGIFSLLFIAMAVIAFFSAAPGGERVIA
jgi:hypothetical protein